MAKRSKVSPQKPAPKNKTATTQPWWLIAEELLEQGWCLDFGKNALHIAKKERLAGTGGSYVAGFYHYRTGHAPYARGETLQAVIEAAAQLARGL